MRALITGITGMAGSFLAEHLLACGDEVVGCSRRGVWPQFIPERLKQQAPLFAWDVSDGLSDAAAQRAIDFQPDCIFHLAALSVPADCGWQQPTPLARATNVEGVQAVVELANKLSQPPRLLLASSSHVYAPVDAGDPIVNEDAPLGPVSGYGQTKLAAEGLLLDEVGRSGLDGLVARAFNHTGPRQLPRMMVPQWARQLVEGGPHPLRVFSLESYLDLSDVRDVVRAYRLLANKGERGGVYNVGSGISRRSGDVFEELCHLAGADRKVVESSSDRRQNPIADRSRLTAATVWNPEIPLKTTLSDVLAFWQSRPFGEKP